MLIAAKTAAVTILDLRSSDDLCLYEDDLSSSETKISFMQRSWNEDDLKGIFLVFAASSDREQNLALCTLCQAKNILCDNSTNPSSGNFISPASVKSASIMLTVSTNGASPLLAARLKKELDLWLQPWSLLASLMGKLRPLVLALDMPQNLRREIFCSILDSPLPRWLEDGQFDLCEQWLLDRLPFITKNELKEMFRDL